MHQIIRYLERALELPVLLKVLLDHLLDGVRAGAKRVSSTASEALLDKVVQGVFLRFTSAIIPLPTELSCTYGTLDTGLDNDEVRSSN